jgi:hypothetical protein
MRISRRAIWIPVCAVAIVCLGLALPAHADTVFTDGTMDLTNYTTVGPVATGPVVILEVPWKSISPTAAPRPPRSGL